MKSLTLCIIILSVNLFSQSTWVNKTATPLNDFNSVKFFNGNTGIVAGAGGIVMRTTDTGINWLNVSSGTTKTINSFCFFDGSRGFASGDSGLILYTSNQGVSWVTRNSTTNNKINSITKVTGTSFIACCSGGLLLRSIDAGATWTSELIAGFNLNSASCVDVNNWYLCGDSVSVLKTTNAGTGWLRYLSRTDGNYSLGDIHFFDNISGCVRIGNTVYRTVNGGVNWSQTFGPFVGGPRKMKFVDNTRGYIIGSMTPVYKTTNAGINWFYNGPSNIYEGQWKDIDIMDSSLSFLCGIEGNVFKSTNNCSTAAHIGGIKFASQYFSFYSANEGYVTTRNHILTTSNGGDKWKIDSYGYNNWFEPTSRNYEKIKFSSFTNGCAAFTSTGMFYPTAYVERTSNGGVSFYGGLGGTQYSNVYDIETVNNSVIVAGSLVSATLKQIFRADSGSNWVTQLTIPNDHNVLSVSFANSSTGIVTGYITNSKSFVIRTSNSGVNWQENTLDQQNRSREANMLSGGTGYILCDSGMILKTTDFGANWFINLGNNSYKFKSIRFLDETHGYAITANNKLAFSSNGGTIWSLHDVASGMTLYSVQFINPVTGYIGCDNGILRTTDGGLTFINMNSGEIPQKFILSQNYPNPFNPVTSIKFDLPKSGFVKMTIYDLLGREITTLVNQQMQAGSYSADWDASAYPSGVYFYKIEAGDFSETKKMVLVK